MSSAISTPGSRQMRPLFRPFEALRQEFDEMFGRQASAIAAEPRMFVFRYRSPEHWLDVFKTFYGPMLKAFAALDANAQAGLRNDLLGVVGEFNRAKDGTMAVPGEYLEVVVTKR